MLERTWCTRQVWTVACGNVASIGLREAGEPVDADEQDVGDAAGLQVGEDVQPELRALGLLEPQAEDVAFAVEVDAQRDVARLVSDGVPVADLHDQRIEVDDRVDALKRAVLPRLRVLKDRVGDLRDQVRRDLGAVDLGQVPLNLADRQTTGVQADHAIVEPDPPGLTLADDLRLKRALAIPRRADPKPPVIGQDRLARLPVAGVPRATGRRLASLIAQMLGQLGLERPVQQPARQLPQQPVRARDLLSRPRARKQRVQQLVADLQRLLIEPGTARQPGNHLSPLGGSRVASLLADNIFLIDPAVSSRRHGLSFRPRLHGSSDTPAVRSRRYRQHSAPAGMAGRCNC